ncbi:hypothetical protein M2345_001343 [Sphingobium sp. B8D3D]|nr:hypothetical protein [Sphingobium sp. B8D3D]MCW2416123.1 hypothetical protein [Sphingobium sp. B8D3A]
MIFDPEQDWLPSHGVLDVRGTPTFPLIGIVEDVPTPFVRPFTLAQHFTRGG